MTGPEGVVMAAILLLPILIFFAGALSGTHGKGDAPPYSPSKPDVFSKEEHDEMVKFLQSTRKCSPSYQYIGQRFSLSLTKTDEGEKGCFRLSFHYKGEMVLAFDTVDFHEVSSTLRVHPKFDRRELNVFTNDMLHVLYNTIRETKAKTSVATHHPFLKEHQEASPVLNEIKQLMEQVKNMTHLLSVEERHLFHTLTEKRLPAMEQAVVDESFLRHYDEALLHVREELYHYIRCIKEKQEEKAIRALTILKETTLTPERKGESSRWKG